MTVNRLTFALLIGLLAGMASGYGQSFKSEQLRYERVREAYKEKEARVKAIFTQKEMSFPPVRILFRIIKSESVLEVWSASAKNDPMKLVKTYRICSYSGSLGPKRRQGDLQMPEGFYYIDRFNPASSYFLSLGINYPNSSDRVLGNQEDPGGDIFIHGDCVSIGCAAMTTPVIKELYIMAVEAKANGQRQIPVYIFPNRMTEDAMADLAKISQGRPELDAFWKNLHKGFQIFEDTKRIPTIIVQPDGLYAFRGN